MSDVWGLARGRGRGGGRARETIASKRKRAAEEAAHERATEEAEGAEGSVTPSNKLMAFWKKFKGADGEAGCEKDAG